MICGRQGRLKVEKTKRSTYLGLQSEVVDDLHLLYHQVIVPRARVIGPEHGIVLQKHRD